MSEGSLGKISVSSHHFFIRYEQWRHQRGAHIEGNNILHRYIVEGAVMTCAIHGTYGFRHSREK